MFQNVKVKNRKIVPIDQRITLDTKHSNRLKEFKIKLKTLDLKLKYFGFRWWHLLVAKRNYQK